MPRLMIGSKENTKPKRQLQCLIIEEKSQTTATFLDVKINKRLTRGQKSKGEVGTAGAERAQSGRKFSKKAFIKLCAIP